MEKTKKTDKQAAVSGVLLTAAEVAVKLSISRSYIYKQIYDKTLPFPVIQVGLRSVRFDSADVDKFIASRKYLPGNT